MTNSWSKRGGYADSKIAGVRSKAAQLGFVQGAGRTTGNPDGSQMGGELAMKHPDGHVLRIASSYGVTQHSNSHSIRLTTPRP